MNDVMTSQAGPERVDTAAWPRTISIIGAAGLVGSSVAAQLATRGVGRRINLQDRRSNLVHAHRIDLGDAQAVLGLSYPEIVAGPPTGAVDLVIVAASMPETPNGDRREFMAANAGLLDSLAEQIRHEAGQHGIILLLTNPVDILADWMARKHGIDPGRFMGYALNDSARLRLAIARELGVDVARVEAMVLGEHGRGQVPVLSAARVDGQPVQWPDGSADRILADVHGWFERWSSLNPGRSSGWATGAGVMHLVRSLSAGAQVVTTASTTGLGELPDTFMALPARLRDGRLKAELPSLSPHELDSLQASGESIHRSAAAIE